MQYRVCYVDTIQVLIGEEEFCFIVHKEVLVRSSKFFQAACNGSFKEATEKTTRLPDLDVDTFQAYVHWAYAGDISLMTSEEATKDGQGQERFKKVVRLYAASDVLDDLRLRNATIDYMVELSEQVNCYPGTKVVAEAYKKTVETSPLRKALVDKYLHLGKVSANYFKEASRFLPREFLVDVIYARMLLDNGKVTPRSTGDLCRYHKHDEEVPKCRKS